MVKLICFIKRKPGMSPEDFHRYWRETHGPLVAGTRSGRHALRYEQNHRLSDDYGRDPGGYDGVTEQWFSSLDDFHASVAEPDYAAIDADMRNFMDTEDIVFVMTHEPDVIVDGAVGPDREPGR